MQLNNNINNDKVVGANYTIDGDVELRDLMDEYACKNSELIKSKKEAIKLVTRAIKNLRRSNDRILMEIADLEMQRARLMKKRESLRREISEENLKRIRTAKEESEMDKGDLLEADYKELYQLIIDIKDLYVRGMDDNNKINDNAVNEEIKEKENIFRDKIDDLIEKLTLAKR